MTGLQDKTDSTSQKANFDPKGKTFTQKVAAFVKDAKDTHGVTVRKNSSTRTAQWQQKHHVAHMFLYNKYRTVRPKHVETGKTTISWDHFSNAKTVWDTIKFSDFLRTSDGKVPAKDNKGEWKDTAKPDKAKTVANVKKIQTNAGIGNSGKAMVSSGLKPCKSPCACTAGRSKHVSGVAEDFNSSDLAALTKKLTAAKLGTLDTYLKTFGLHRPLKDHATSPEKWHVESL